MQKVRQRQRPFNVLPYALSFKFMPPAHHTGHSIPVPKGQILLPCHFQHHHTKVNIFARQENKPNAINIYII
jgi:hypothetical protein